MGSGIRAVEKLCRAQWGGFFAGLGEGPEVPKPLQWSGRVYNRYACSSHIMHHISECWVSDSRLKL